MSEKKIITVTTPSILIICYTTFFRDTQNLADWTNRDTPFSLCWVYSLTRLCSKNYGKKCESHLPFVWAWIVGLDMVSDWRHRGNKNYKVRSNKNLWQAFTKVGKHWRKCVSWTYCNMYICSNNKNNKQLSPKLIYTPIHQNPCCLCDL